MRFNGPTSSAIAHAYRPGRLRAELELDEVRPIEGPMSGNHVGIVACDETQYRCSLYDDLKRHSCPCHQQTRTYNRKGLEHCLNEMVRSGCGREELLDGW